MRSRILILLVAVLIAFGSALWADETNTTKGKPLPADGGEPGKVYMQYCKAMEAGDFATLKKVMTAEEAKTLDIPEFKQAFPMMQSMHAKEIKITGGTVDGTTATLQATGKDPSGKTSKGTVTLLMENKEWKVKEDAWATDMN